MRQSPESRFISGPEGVQSELPNRIEDFKNQCGRQFNPDRDEYWELMKEKLETLPVADLELMQFNPGLFGEGGQKLSEIAEQIKWTKEPRK
ncbi:MAG: hypothetical protein Q8P78_00765 [bacterium]|nr:hypothetical protein [bacterium]